jgi:hypothetical protein
MGVDGKAPLPLIVFAHLGKKSSFGALVAFDVTHGSLQPFPHIVLFKLSKKH